MMVTMQGDATGRLHLKPNEAADVRRYGRLVICIEDGGHPVWRSLPDRVIRALDHGEEVCRRMSREEYLSYRLSRDS